MILGYGDYPGAWEVHNKLFTSAGCHGGILHPGTSRDKGGVINLTAQISVTLLVQVDEATTTFINVQSLLTVLHIFLGLVKLFTVRVE